MDSNPHITQQELESLGFEADTEKKSVFTNELTHFYKNVDNGHIIEGHDTTEVFVNKDGSFVTIEIDHHSSYDYSGKRLAFQGRCTNIEFFTQILKAVTTWF